MASNDIHLKAGSVENTTTIKRILDSYAEESISMEQMGRVLEPVLKLIREGKFDRTRESRLG